MLHYVSGRYGLLTHFFFYGPSSRFNLWAGIGFRSRVHPRRSEQRQQPGDFLVVMSVVSGFHGLRHSALRKFNYVPRRVGLAAGGAKRWESKFWRYFLAFRPVVVRVAFRAARLGAIDN